ncbi:MAG: DUF1580 domain-containing protein [Planctomycetaceae bacterium]|nr:DUF1580 domain-containing protein [Planctomycetales bacterium]MCB9925278.1 DUF1580 domain-containing protein [Planctomycetaceae bacterium]
MPIDITQKLVSFAELARALPRRRRNRPVHVSTIHRWRQRGVDGVRLEAIRIGGAWHTSWEAFARFCERLTIAKSAEDRKSVTSAATPNAHSEADASLDQGGW